jgi:hypothetical protein
MSNILKIAGAGAFAAEETDENFNQTVLLLHGDGTNGAQNNTFLDSSTNNFTITRNGNTTQGTFSPFSAGWSNYFNYGDGSDYITFADSSAFALGSSEFTIECWLYSTFDNQTQRFAGQLASNGATTSWSFEFQKSVTNKFVAQVASGSTIYTLTSTNNIPSNQWVHLAFVRDGNTARIYINGVQEDTENLTSVTINDSAGGLSIGRFGDWVNGASALWGYVSNFRLVVGDCVYPSGTTFTPPTSPLTAITGTGLLTCQSNRFVNAVDGTAATVGGSPKVTPFSPFAPTAAYSPSVNGGSGYFDGTGDYLTAPDDADFDFGSGAFTIECWYYKMANANQSLVDTRSSSSNGYLIWPESDGTISVDVAGTSRVLNGTIVFPLNAWTHIVFVKDGSNNFASFINGVRDDLDTATTTLNAATSFTIGAKSLGSSGVVPITGYLSGFKVVKGSAIYDPTDTTIPIPTAPPTSDANTALLCNFTNAGIFDQTGKNNLETLGNCQIDTTTKVFGTGSLEFDGTADYLFIPSQPNIWLGTGPFTIQFWMYRNSAKPRFCAFAYGDGDASGTIAFYSGSSGNFIFVASGTASASDYTPTADAWHFVTITRDASGNVVVYFDGVSRLTDTSTENLNLSLTIGRLPITSQYDAQGFIDDFRIIRGVVLDGTIVPTAPFLDL